jgi:hypothetical protein
MRPYLEKPFTQIGLVEWLKMKAPGPQKKKKKEKKKGRGGMQWVIKPITV